MTVPEAELERTDAGLVPRGEGWFVLNARDASWIRSEERGQDTDFEGGQEWAELGFRIQVVAPGQRSVYHGERGQEDFLVVSGECVLVIEGGTLIDGTEFDSSYKRNAPIEFPLNRVIKGWTEGVQLMKEGGKTILYIPSALAYGPTGTPGGPIGPNETLIFEIELLEVK